MLKFPVFPGHFTGLNVTGWAFDEIVFINRCFHGQEEPFNLSFEANMDEKSFKGPACKI